VNRFGFINPKKILIRGTNWVGDAVMSVPAMKEIRRLFPDAHISLLVRPWVRDVYCAVEFVDEILEYDKLGMHRGLLGYRRLIGDLKSRRFDLAILLQNAFEAAFIAWCARIPRRIGYARDGRSFLLTDACPIDPAVRRMHQVYYYLDMLSILGLPLHNRRENNEAIPSIAIGVRDSDHRAAREMLHTKGIVEGDSIVGINPGAFYGEAKRWFADRYAEVADALASRHGTRIVLFGSQTDRAIAEEVAARMKHPSVILAGQTTLGQLMGLLKKCSLLITNDSGPMHLAAALDVPQLALFGSTSEIATGPLSRQAVVIKHTFDCNPCFLRKCPTDFRCMKGITVQEVVEAAQIILEKQILDGI
jgi:heptosyltransferase II